MKLISLKNLSQSLSSVKTWVQGLLSKILPSLSGEYIDDLLEPGVYPWCSSGRPANIATGSNHWTLIVTKSTTPDFNGFYTIEQTAYGREGDSGKVAKRIIFSKPDTTDYTSAGGWINCTRGANIMSFNGFIECDTIDQSSIDSIYGGLENYEQQWYLAGDSSKRVTGGSVTFSSSLAALVHPEDSRGVAANLGDFLLFAKDGEGRRICRLVPVNDAKAPTDNFPGTYGILTPNDRMDMDNALMGTYSEGNMNEALTSGFYPYCTVGRPEGCNNSDWFTCITHRSRQVDGNGYYSVYQTCVGRSSSGALKGKIFQRLIFYKPSNRGEDNYGEWYEVNKDYSEDIMNSISGSLHNYKKLATLSITESLGLQVSVTGGTTAYSNGMFEVYSGDGSDYAKNFSILLPLTASDHRLDSIFKIKAFYRKGNSTQGFTTYIGESHAKISIVKDSLLDPVSNEAKVRSIGDLDYPFTETEKGWQNLDLAKKIFETDHADHHIKLGKFNTSSAKNYYLKIEGSFKVPSSWFVIGGIEIWIPQEKELQVSSYSYGGVLNTDPDITPGVTYSCETPGVTVSRFSGFSTSEPKSIIYSKYPITFSGDKIKKSQYVDYLTTENGYYVYTLTYLPISSDDYVLLLNCSVYE